MTDEIDPELEPVAAREFDRQRRKSDLEHGYCSTCGQPLAEPLGEESAE